MTSDRGAPRAMESPPAPASGGELKAVLDAERGGVPFLVFRDGAGAQVIRVFDDDGSRLTVGRHSSCDVSLAWDGKVSRTHAILERLGHAWTVADDGISRNGTFLNGSRLSSRQRLVDRDVLRVGATTLAFRHPQDSTVGPTIPDESLVTAQLTRMQEKVLAALCRPLLQDAYAAPATNTQIADELVLSVDAVKTHMRGLFERFEVDDLPQNQKRARVAAVALRAGLIRPGGR